MEGIIISQMLKVLTSGIEFDTSIFLKKWIYDILIKHIVCMSNLLDMVQYIRCFNETSEIT